MMQLPIAPVSPGTNKRAEQLCFSMHTPGRGRGCVAIFLLMIAGVMFGASGPDRPRDPWVFRCVLDGNPRMAVIALHEDLWLAYDADSCSLRQVWSDGVKFDGAVYTTVHGPQPTSKGEPDFAGPDGAVWRLLIDEEMMEIEPLWRGYTLRGSFVTLQYELPLPDGGHVRIDEMPMMDAFGGVPDTPYQLDRRFTISDLPDDVHVQLVIAQAEPNGLDRFSMRGKHMTHLEREAVADDETGAEQERLTLTFFDDDSAVLSMDLRVAAE